MKRVWIVVGIASAIVVLGITTLLHLSTVSKDMDYALEEIQSAIQEEQPEKILDKSIAFQKIWDENEAEMMRYIHHDELDSITGIVARLRPLAEFEDYTELSAEVSRLRHLIRHIYESEVPTFNNIL